MPRFDSDKRSKIHSCFGTRCPLFPAAPAHQQNGREQNEAKREGVLDFLPGSRPPH